MPAKNWTITGRVDSYKVNISGAYTYVRVSVGGRNFQIGTSNKNPTAFVMTAITCLKDAFLQGKQVTVVGSGERPPALLSLTSIELHK